jgi:hypothetical protein
VDISSICSPAIAEKLKSLGFPLKESDYCWVNGVLEKRDWTMDDCIPAYTDEEIFDDSPDWIDYPGTRYELELEQTPYMDWKAYFSDGTYILNNHFEIAVSSVDARAKILIYIIEQELFGYD